MRPFTLRAREPSLVQPAWFWNLACGVVVALSLISWLILWSVIDLWQLATWPRAHLEQGGGIAPQKLLKLALFGFGVLLCLGIFITWAVVQQFGFIEWFPSVFAMTFIYAVATGIRF